MGWDGMERRGGKLELEETEVDGLLVGFRDTLDFVFFFWFALSIDVSQVTWGQRDHDRRTSASVH
jgi:hypothetical protein